MLILAQNRNLGLTASSDIRIERFKSLKCFFYHFYGDRELRSWIRWRPIFHVRFMLIWAQNRNFGLTRSSDIRIERFNCLNYFFYHFLWVRELKSWIRWSPIFPVCFLFILAQNRNLGLTPSSNIIIERFKSLNCFFYQFLGVRELKSWIRWSSIFLVCTLLILAKQCNLGLTPTSDLKIRRFKSLKCFFTISKGFVS